MSFGLVIAATTLLSLLTVAAPWSESILGSRSRVWVYRLAALLGLVAGLAWLQYLGTTPPSSILLPLLTPLLLLESGLCAFIGFAEFGRYVIVVALAVELLAWMLLLMAEAKVARQRIGSAPQLVAAMRT